MKTERRIRWGVALLFLALMLPAGTLEANGQTAGVVAAGSRVLEADAKEIVREINDPYTGARWLLLRDSSHPGGPGRLVLAGERRDEPRILIGDRAGDLTEDKAQIGARQEEPERVPALPVIHAGDRLIVEENSAVVEARLEAVALGPAAVGSLLQARLRIGGGVVRVVALASGCAEFQSEIGVRP